MNQNITTTIRGRIAGTPSRLLQPVAKRLLPPFLLLLFTLLPAAVQAQFTTTSDGNGGLVITGYTGTVPASLTIPPTLGGNPVTAIGTNAFNSQGTITSVTFAAPSSVTSIGDKAFYRCTGLNGISIPSSVTSIGTQALAICTALPAITVSAGNPAYCSVGGILFDEAQHTLIQYPAGNPATSYTIPGGVTSIWDGAFQGCTGLTSVTIPASVTSIEAYAFALTSLTSAMFIGNAPSMGMSVFYSAPSSFKVIYYSNATGFTSPTWTDSYGDSYPSYMTPNVPPSVTTPTSASVTTTTASLGGNVISNGGATVTAIGVVYSPTAINPNPQLGGTGVIFASTTGPAGVFTLFVGGLTPGTAYTFAAYATNSAGTGYSATGTFTTLSNNSNLSGLALGSGSLSPAFASATTSYVAVMPGVLAHVTATPTTASTHATVTVNGITVASGSASPAITLTNGTNTISVVVTAQDGATTTAYTIAVNNTPYGVWQGSVFTNPSDLANPNVSGLTATPAHDGVTNLMKYALAIAPMASATNSLPNASTGGGYLNLIYRQNKQATDVTYTVQASSSLSANSWSPATTVLAQEDLGTYWLVIMRDNVPSAGNPHRFMRLQVSK